MKRMSTQTGLRGLGAAWLALALAGAASGAVTNYVDANRPDDSGDGSSWETAKKTLQAAIDITTGAGDTVLVTNGVYDLGGAVTPGYSLTNRVCLTNPIVVRSVNGWEHTIIKGAESSGGGCGTGALRCVYITNGACLSGFTLSNGYMMASGDVRFEQSGGGAFFERGGIVSNCLFVGGEAVYTCGGRGMGAYLYSGGKLDDCTLRDFNAFGNDPRDVVYFYNGGSPSALVTNCVVTRNNKGGIYGYWGGHVYNSTISENRGPGVTFVGGGQIQDSRIVGNTNILGGQSGGGLNLEYATVARNCEISGNTAKRAAGVYFGRNSGTSIPLVENCTISGNMATNNAEDGGGGIGTSADACGRVLNCIVWGNTHPGYASSNIYDISANFSVTNSCAGPLPDGEGNIAAEPRFRGAEAGNYRLGEGSPCINAGTNQSWMVGATDLYGIARIRDGIVDMGAYEFYPGPGTIFLGR